MHSKLNKIIIAFSILLFTFENNSTIASNLNNIFIEKIINNDDLLAGKLVKVEGSYLGYNGGNTNDTPTAEYSFSTMFTYGDLSHITIETEYKTPTSDRSGKINKKITFVKEDNKWYELLYGFKNENEFINAKSARKMVEPPHELGAGNALYGGGIYAIQSMVSVYNNKTIANLLSSSKVSEKSPIISEINNTIEMTWNDPCSMSKVVFQKNENNFTLKSIDTTSNLCGNTGKLLKNSFKFLNYSIKPFMYASEIVNDLSFGNEFHYKSMLKIKSINILDKDKVKIKDVSLNPGWMVQDTILGISYLTGRSPEETIKSIRSLLEK